MPVVDSGCFVCGDSIGIVERMRQSKSPHLLCRSLECARLMQRESQMSAVSFENMLRFQAQNLRDRIAARKEYRERVSRVEVQQSGQRQAVRERAVVAGIGDDSVPILDLPSGCTGVRPLPATRIANYRAHVEGLLAQHASEVAEENTHMVAAGELAFASEQRLQRVSGLRKLSAALCGLCRGGCCVAGADRAYLTAATLGRVRREHPDWSDEDILQAYLSHLAGETASNACINQTATGCGLPRSLRSDTCNGYFCSSLLAYQKQRERLEVGERVLVIRRGYGNGNHYHQGADSSVKEVAMIDDSGVTSLPLSWADRGDAPA